MLLLEPWLSDEPRIPNAMTKGQMPNAKAAVIQTPTGDKFLSGICQDGWLNARRDD